MARGVGVDLFLVVGTAAVMLYLHGLCSVAGVAAAKMRGLHGAQSS
jgi:hypothetical protein